MQAERQEKKGRLKRPFNCNVRSYGRLPVGNGHAAAGFNAVFAPGAAAVDGAAGDGIAAGLAIVRLAAGLRAAGFLTALRDATRFLADFFLCFRIAGQIE